MFFDEIQVGDEVVIFTYPLHPLEVVKVDRITKTQFIAGKRRFLKSSGRGVGGNSSRISTTGWGRDQRLTTRDEAVQKNKVLSNKKEAARLFNMLRTAFSGWDTEYSLEQLRDVVDYLELETND